MSDNSRIYRIDWTYLDETGVISDYIYIGAESEKEALGELPDDEDLESYSIREASQEEVEAYVSGYEAASDAYRAIGVLDAIINGKHISISDPDVAETDEKFDAIVKDLNINTEDDKE